MERVTIVMYHYVRDLAHSRYPRIRGLAIDGFRRQLDYIARFYEVIRMEDVIAAATHGADLPSNALLLTFDDGFRDHFETVAPLLVDRGWQGSFFPCTQPLAEGRVLGVHKIHFVLATVDDANRLLLELEETVEEQSAGSARIQLPKVRESHRFDDTAVTTFKRLLQRELPHEVRARALDHFFRRYVTSDEAGFAAELYADAGQLREMRSQGMYIGCHGHTHAWLDRLDPGSLEDELRESLKTWDTLGLTLDRWVMCYPYGGYNGSLGPVVRHFGAVVGLLAEPGIADLRLNNPFALPRLDTNDLPQTPELQPNEWTLQIVEDA